MINRPNHLQLEALATIKNNPNFQIITQWLNESLSETLSKCMTEHDSTALRQAQGEAKTLFDFLHFVEEARAIIEKNKR